MTGSMIKARKAKTIIMGMSKTELQKKLLEAHNHIEKLETENKMLEQKYEQRYDYQKAAEKAKLRAETRGETYKDILMEVIRELKQGDA